MGDLSTLDQLVDPANAAVVIVDMQNDYCHPDGAFAKDGHDIAMVETMLPRLATFLERAREAGVHLVFIRMLHDDDHSSGPMRERQGRLRVGSDYPRPDTWGAELCKPLTMRAGDVEFTKYRYGAFTNADLEPYLREKGIQSLIFTGVATNVCVESTAREAFMRDFYVVVARDCVAACYEHTHNGSLENLEHHFGRVVPASEIEGAWERR
ncbi:MAG: cysteine hydrolase [Firmicutes bacterium]|nr:cysteine hydrolase [Bacillota bacterium]